MDFVLHNKYSFEFANMTLNIFFNCGKTFFNLQINNLDKSNLIGSLDNAFIFTIADKTNLAIYEEFNLDARPGRWLEGVNRDDGFWWTYIQNGKFNKDIPAKFNL